MDTTIELRTLLKIKQKSVKHYANALGYGEMSMRLRLKDTKRFTIEDCNASDKFLDLPKGTTHEVINGNVMFSDILEWIERN